MGRSYGELTEVLMRLDSWSIERSWEKPSENTIRPEWYHDNETSYVKHRCPGEKAVETVYVWPDSSKNCWRCTEPIPDGIKTVWIMHNWEAIQNGR